MMYISIAKLGSRSMMAAMFNYMTFGRVEQNISKSAYSFGVPNFNKRLQAKNIMQHVVPASGEAILDFGCGGGFFTYEFAKKGALATGVDISPGIPQSIIKSDFQCRFVTVESGQRLPFEDKSFDKIFMSEVLVVLPDPQATLRELNRLLRPNGSLFIVNTLGRFNIREAYEGNTGLVRFFKKCFSQTPLDYAEYCKRFRQNDKPMRNSWYTLDEIQSFLTTSGFIRTNIFYPFKRWGIDLLCLYQFYKMCRGNGLVVEFNILMYLFLELLNAFCPSRNPSNVIIRTSKSDDP